MNTNDLFIALLIISVIVAALGGLGFAGLGKDSRGLDTRPHSNDRPSRSLLYYLSPAALPPHVRKMRKEFRFAWTG